MGKYVFYVMAAKYFPPSSCKVSRRGPKKIRYKCKYKMHQKPLGGWVRSGPAWKLQHSQTTQLDLGEGIRPRGTGMEGKKRKGEKGEEREREGEGKGGIELKPPDL